MKTAGNRWYCSILLISVLVFSGRTAPAQQATVPAGAAGAPRAKVLDIRLFSGLGPRSKVKTPVFNTNATRGIKPPQDWVKIEVIFDTFADWLDDIEFKFYAISATTEGGKTVFTLYRNSVKYGDIEKGRNHSSSMFLRPCAITRYGELIGAAVEIAYGGNVIAYKSEQNNKLLPEDWWKNPRVTDNESVVARGGYLLKRSESPFSLVNIDDNEFIK